MDKSLPLTQSQSSSHVPFSFPEVRVVEASAGSGKTTTLAKRYVQLVLNPEIPLESMPIRQILAITFTNKSAFEMKARILEFLKRIAMGQLREPEVEELLIPIGLDPTTARLRAFAIMETIIRHYNYFQVQTIDSFINALLVGCAFKIDLSANFRIKRDYHRYLELSLDQLIEEAQAQPELMQLFERFLHHYLFLENRGGWFPKKDMLVLMKALFEKSNIYGVPFLKKDIPPEDLIIRKRSILKHMHKLLEDIPEGVDRRLAESLTTFLVQHDHGFDVDWLTDYLARPEFPVRKGFNVSLQIKGLWTRLRHEIRELCEEEALTFLKPYVLVFSEVLKRLEILTVKEDILFLEQLNLKARRLFDKDGLSVEELYYRLATRMHHYLIDEFQDTSRLQWENLFLMVEEALSTGGSLFYVGDKKQAIYGFRGGEAKLFDEIQKRFQAFPILRETLTKNYRSRKILVDMNNQIFSLENLRRFNEKREDRETERRKKEVVTLDPEDWQKMESIFQASLQEALPQKQGGYVRMEVIDESQKDQCEKRVRESLLQLLAEIKTRWSYRDLAILTRDNQEVETLTTWLLAEGVPVESERTLNIKENQFIQELVALLTFLHSPTDNINFATFLLGDIFVRASGVPPSRFQEFVFGLRYRRDREKDFSIYTAFRETFPELWERFYEDFFKSVGLYPLYEFVLSLLHRLQCFRNFPEAQGFFMRFLELIQESEEDYPDLASFLEYFAELEGEDLFVHVCEHDSIRILTIHKAKGLEFPVVIIPFLAMSVHVGPSGREGLPHYILDVQEDHLDLIRLKTKYTLFSETLARMWHKEYIHALLTELNNIYVALTRAAEELYALIPTRYGQGMNLVPLLIPAELYKMGSLPQKTVTVNLEDSTVREPFLPLSPPEEVDWMRFLQEEFKEMPSVSREQLKKGEMVHAVLSFLGNLAGVSLEAGMDTALQQARKVFPGVEDWTEVRSLLQEIFSQPKLRPFFTVEDGEVFCEREVVDAKGHGRRMDRMIVRSQEVWILDYKSLRTEREAHRRQVAEYRLLIQEIYPRHRVRGFLLYLDTVTLEEVEGAP